MKVKKKNGKQESVDIMKVISVLDKANANGETPQEEVRKVVQKIVERLAEVKEPLVSSIDIEKVVEEELIRANLVSLARSYIVGCYEKENIHRKQELDNSILGIIEEGNESVATENANKNPSLLSTQRDYIAGEVNKDLCKRFIYNKEVIDAHDKGVIHVHK